MSGYPASEVQILIRNGTLAEWGLANPMLANGEMGIVVNPDDRKIIEGIKFGTGLHPWNDLPWFRLEGRAALPASGGDNGQVIAKIGENAEGTNLYGLIDAGVATQVQLGNVIQVAKSGALHSEVQTALDVVSANQIVRVAPGNYSGNLTIQSGNFILYGMGSVGFTKHVTLTGTFNTNGEDLVRAYGIRIQGKTNINGGSGHIWDSMHFGGPVVIGGTTGGVFYRCRFQDDVTIQNTHTLLPVRFIDCEFKGRLINSSNVPVTLVNTAEAPTEVQGESTILGQYGNKDFYQFHLYNKEPQQTENLRMLVLEPDGRVSSMEVSGVGGGGSYTNSKPTTSTVGGITAGSTFSQVPLTEMFDRLLYPYQNPSFSGFLIGGITDKTLEVGTAIAGELRAVSWSIHHPANVQANSIRIRDVTRSSDLAANLPNTGNAAVNIPVISGRTTPGQHTFSLIGVNTNGHTFNATTSVNWRYRAFWGTSENSVLTSAQVQGLQNSTLDDLGGVHAFATGGYKYVAYPTSDGQRTVFKDLNTGFDVSMQPPTTVTLTNPQGVSTDYYVHRSTHVLGGSITIAIS